MVLVKTNIFYLSSTPDEDHVSKALVFLIVLYVSSYRWVHFSRAVLLKHLAGCSTRENKNLVHCVTRGNKYVVGYGTFGNKHLVGYGTCYGTRENKLVGCDTCGNKQLVVMVPVETNIYFAVLPVKTNM